MFLMRHFLSAAHSVNIRVGHFPPEPACISLCAIRSDKPTSVPARAAVCVLAAEEDPCDMTQPDSLPYKMRPCVTAQK